MLRAGRPACIMAPGRQESDHMTFVPIEVSLAAWCGGCGRWFLREATR
jgi:hypothetical protein